VQRNAPSIMCPSLDTQRALARGWRVRGHNCVLEALPTTSIDHTPPRPISDGQSLSVVMADQLCVGWKENFSAQKDRSSHRSLYTWES